MHSNCPTYKQKLEELKSLHNEFQEELEVFKSSRDSVNIWETRKEIENIILYFRKEDVFIAEPFSFEELAKYEKDELGRIKLGENTTWKEIERFSQTPDANVDLTDISVKFKNMIFNWKGSIRDYSLTFDYPDLEFVGENLTFFFVASFTAPKLRFMGGSLFASNAAFFSVPVLESAENLSAEEAIEFNAPMLKSVEKFINTEKAEALSFPFLESVGRRLNAKGANSFSAPKLKNVEKIQLTRNKINNRAIDLPQETIKKIIWKD